MFTGTADELAARVRVLRCPYTVGTGNVHRTVSVRPSHSRGRYDCFSASSPARSNASTWYVDGRRKLPTGGHLWRILWPWFLPAYGQIVPRALSR